MIHNLGPNRQRPRRGKAAAGLLALALLLFPCARVAGSAQAPGSDRSVRSDTSDKSDPSDNYDQPGGSPSSAPSSSAEVSLFDVLTTAGAPANPPVAAAGPPVTDAARFLSAEGAAVLLADARKSLDEEKTGQAREILGDILSRRGIDDPSAQAAALLLAETADSSVTAERYLQLFQAAGEKTLSAKASAIALAWADQVNAQPDAQSDTRPDAQSDATGDPPALRLIALAERFALESGDRFLLRRAILARAEFYIRTEKQPGRAWETLATAEKNGVVYEPGADWLELRGDAALALRKNDDAREAYLQLAARFPDSPETLRRLGRLGLLQELGGDTEDARRSFALFRSSAAAGKNAGWIDGRLQALRRPYFPPLGAPGSRPNP